MRSRLRSRVAGALIAGLGLAALPVAVSAPALAVDACTSRTVSQPFAAWADTNDYFPVTSGTCTGAFPVRSGKCTGRSRV